jgi:excisionase family DNA binding protein
VSEAKINKTVEIEGMKTSKQILQGEEGMEYETLLKSEQVARLMGISEATVRRWVLLRYIPYRKIGKAVRFSLPEIQEWLKSRRVTPLENLPAPGDTGKIEGWGHDENH